MGPKPFKANPYSSGGATEAPFGEHGTPQTHIGFISSLIRLARLRGFGFGAKRPGATPVSTVKNPVTMGSHGKIV